MDVTIYIESGADFIDVDYSDSIYNKSNLKLNYSKGSSGRVSKQGLTSNLIFKGEAFKEIERRFFKGDCEEYATVKIDIDCCNIPRQRFYITKESIESYCPLSCTATINLINRNQERDAFRCLLNTDIGLIEDITVAEIWVKKVVSLQPFSIGNSNISGAVRPIKRRLNLVCEWLDYAAKKCGLDGGLKSSILKGKDYDKMLFWPPMKGSETSIFQPGIIIQEPDEYNPVDLLDNLEGIFNAEFRIIGNQLCFERKDQIQNNPTKVYNLADLQIKKPICYNFVNGEGYKGIKFNYCVDNKDTFSSEVTNLNLYNGVCVYNSFNLQTTNGFKDVTPNISITPITPANDSQPLRWITDCSKPTDKLKLMIWDSSEGILNAGSLESANYPLHFQTTAAGKEHCDLKTRFFDFEKELPCPIEVNESIEILWDCQLARDIISFGTELAFFDDNYGNGYAESISIDFGNKSITIEGLTFRNY